VVISQRRLSRTSF